MILKDERDMPGASSRTGLSQAEPEEVSALTGFDPSRCVWWSVLDGLYNCWVERKGSSIGELHVARTSGEPVASGRVIFSYQAAFGPDVDDVADWQSWVMEFFEGECGSRNPLKASAIEARSAETGNTDSARQGESAIPQGDAQ